jgi:hypothetical protein
MKSYGVNWFFVWVGLLVFMGPLYAWTAEVLPIFTSYTHHSISLAFSQAFAMACGFTYIYYFAYSNTIADPAKLEALRQKLEKSKSHRNRPFRWLLSWVGVFAVVVSISVICRLVFHQLSWLHLVVYSFMLPCTSLFCLWLRDRATKRGRLEQLLKGEGTMR